MTPDEIVARHPPVAPDLRLVWTAVVDVGPREDWGASPSGHRYMVPILGGSFLAGPGFEGLSGRVLPGGADRQSVLADGIRTLDALYEMQTDHGEILTVRNRVKVDETATPLACKRSVIEVSAPEGRFGWMNHRVFLGTLETARPERAAVIIRGWG